MGTSKYAPFKSTAFSLAVLLGACASVPAPTEQMAVSVTALNDAVAAGAAEFAPVELRSAQEKLARANTAVGAKDYERARYLAEEAEADANLAAVKARSAKAQKAVREVQESIRTLREEIDRQVR